MFGFKTKTNDIFTFDTIEKAIEAKSKIGDSSTIMYNKKLEALLVILKQG